MADLAAVHVHRLTAGDWSRVRRLRTAALADTPQAFLGDLGAERARSAEQWQVVCGQGTWITATVGGQDGGLVHVIRDPDSGDCYVESMWVSPRCRRSGVGRRLLVAAADLAREHRRAAVFLWVLDGNPQTEVFYRRLGFVPTGRRQPIGPQGRRVEEEFRLPVGAAASGPVPRRGSFAAR